MSSVPDIHPDSALLERYLLGKLDEQASAAIEQHVGHCDDCLQQLDVLGHDDAVVDLLQSSHREAALGSTIAPGDDESLLAASAPSENWKPRVPGYIVGEELGRGGMGVVYAAVHEKLDRPVALKTLLPAVACRADLLRRFEREAQALARLHHPHIVQIFEVGQSDDCLFVALEFVAGCNLDEYSSDGPLEPRAAASLLAKIAQAMHFAHQRGILHRDLKPSNILIDERDTPKIADFGLAKLIEGDVEATRAGTLIGTPGYMAPEQASGQDEVHVAADVYGLGAILYRCLTGRAPFTGDSITEVLIQMRDGSPPWPRSLVAGVPRDLATICMKCLERNPRDRYPSAADLADELQRFLDHKPIHARPASVSEHVWRWSRRNPVLAGLLSFLVLGLCSGTAMVTGLWLRAERAFLTAEKTRLHLDDALHDAIAARNTARQNLYVNQISNSWSQYLLGNLPAARGLLRNTTDDPELKNFRGWEWHFIEQLCEGELRRIEAHESTAAYAVAISPDETVLATAHGPFDALNKPESRAVIFLRDSQSGRELGRIDGHRGRVNGMMFSADGLRLAVSSSDGWLRVWDVEAKSAARNDNRAQTTGREVYRVGGLAPHSKLQLSPDGRYAGFVDKDNAAVIYDLAEDVAVVRRTVSILLTQIGFDVARRRIVALGVDYGQRPHHLAVEVGDWDSPPLRKWEEIDTVGGGVAFDAERGRLAVGDTNGKISVIALDGATLTMHGGNHRCAAAAFDPSGQLLAAGDQNGSITLWDVYRQVQRFTLSGHEGPVTGLCFATDGSLLVSSSLDGTVRTWDITRPPVVNFIEGIRGDTCEIAMRPDSQTLVTAGPGFCRWIDVVSGNVLIEQVLDGDTQPNWRRNDYRLRADGDWLAAPDGQNASNLTLFDTQTGKRGITLTGLTSRVNAVAFSGDGRYVAAATTDTEQGKPSTQALIWNVDDGALLTTKQIHAQGTVTAAALNNDASLFAVSTHGEAAVSVFDTNSGRRLHCFADVTLCCDLAFHPQRQLLVAAELEPSRVHVWDVPSGRALYPPLSAPSGIASVSFSPTGDRLVAAGQTAQVQLWETETGNPLMLLDSIGPSIGARGWTPNVVFSPDGCRIVSQHLGRFINVWSIAGERADVKEQRQADWERRRSFWHLSQANAAKRAGQVEATRFHAIRAARAADPGVAFWEQMTWLQNWLRDSNAAEQSANQCVQGSPDNPWALLHRARLLWLRHRPAEALSDLNRAQSLFYHAPAALADLKADCQASLNAESATRTRPSSERP